MTTGHEPKRPKWTCDGCGGGKPWPCDPARVGLREMYAGNPSGLATHLQQLMEFAAREAPMPKGELFERFVAWTR